jgi:murein tripeptide amidase MpaA
MFSKLLTQPANGKQAKLAALFHSDIEQLMMSMAEDFPGIVKLSSIGKTYEGRNITLMTIDARNNLIKNGNQLSQQERKDYKAKPAILLTGQIHARELITSSMVLYTSLKLLHGGIVHKN